MLKHSTHSSFDKITVDSNGKVPHLVIQYVGDEMIMVFHSVINTYCSSFGMARSYIEVLLDS